MRMKLLSFFLAGLMICTAVAVRHYVVFGSRGNTAAATISIATPKKDVDEGRRHLLKSVNYQPENLLKITARDVRTILSEPELVRRESPTVIWQYRSDVCVLDLFFVTSAAAVTGERVAHYEMRARDKAAKESFKEATCMQSLGGAGKGPRMVGVSSFYKSR